MIMYAILVILAMLLGFAGLYYMMLLQATTVGVALISVACLVAILARLAQANEHQKQLVASLYEIALTAYQQQEKK